MTPEDLFNIFSQLNIAVTTVTHEPVFTCAAADRLNGIIRGAHNKNLFLRSKKDTYLLVSMLSDSRLDIKALSQELGYGSLSFASEDQLKSHLGIEPGHVTPFALINRSANNNIHLILDKEMMEHEFLNFHPLKNHMTTTISRDGFLMFLKYLDLQPLILMLPKL